MEKNCLIDVIGVVLQVGELNLVKTRNGKEVGKRTITLVDRGLVSVDLAIWGTIAEKFEEHFEGVIAVKGAKLSFFNNRTLTTQSTSQVICNPDITEAYLLRGWLVSLPLFFLLSDSRSSDKFTPSLLPKARPRWLALTYSFLVHTNCW